MSPESHLAETAGYGAGVPAMKTSRTPILILGLLYVVFLGYLAHSVPQLPQRVATHFDAGGQADGWMDRASYVRFTAVFGFVFPLSVVGICYAIRFFPNGTINLPQRDYWLAPERRAETMAYLVRHSLWFACLALGLVLGVHVATIHANRQQPPQLSGQWMFAVLGGFLLGTAVWIVGLVRRFRRVEGG